MECHIVGVQGIGTEYLYSVAEELGILERVMFHGVLDEGAKIRLLQQNKFYWQVSEHEGFGHASLEALACGSVVIHSEKGGLKDVVGNHGYLVPEECSFKDVAQEIYKLSLNDKLYTQYQKGLTEHLAKFSMSVRESAFETAIN